MQHTKERSERLLTQTAAFVSNAPISLWFRFYGIHYSMLHFKCGIIYFTLRNHNAETASIRPTATHTTQGTELILNSQKHAGNIKSPEQSQNTSFHKLNINYINTLILFSKYPYLPMYPSHASPSVPGPHSRWTRLKKSHWAWSPHDSLLSLPPSVCCLSQQPLPSTACPSLATASAEQQQWSLYCLVTWPQSSSPRGHRLAWGPMTARGYLSGTDSPISAAIQQYTPTPALS